MPEFWIIRMVLIIYLIFLFIEKAQRKCFMHVGDIDTYNIVQYIFNVGLIAYGFKLLTDSILPLKQSQAKILDLSCIHFLYSAQ